MSFMDGNAAFTLVILIVLISFSAFFSATETAYTSLNKVRLKNMANSGNRKAAKILALSENYDRLISTILIGNNIVNILSTSLATAMFVRMLGDSGVTVSTVVMTMVILLFGEVAPKSLARISNEKIAFAGYPLLTFIVKVFTPLSFLMGCWQKLMGRLVRDSEEHGITEEELITMVEEAESDGEIDSHESELIRSAIEFTDLCVEDILTPRVDMVAVDVTDTEQEIADQFAESGFSRLPVYEDNIDNIIGILHEKDFYRNRGSQSVREMMTKPIYVMPTTRLSVLLKLLQQSKGHMAVAADEYGGVIGIVTLEDILEELVGEIWDEHDEIVEEIHKLPNGRYQVECNTALDDFLRLFPLKREYESTTVSGWVLEELGAFPQKGDSFDCENLHVTVSEVDKRRVLQIIVEVRPKEPEEEE